MRRSSMVRHLRTVPTVTDPTTGRTYPIPAGGADDGDDSAGDDGAADDADDSGGADDSDDSAGDDGADDDADDADDKLGPAGEKALREMKKRARAAERELRRLKAQQGNDGKNDDGTPDADELRQQIEAEVRAEAARDRALDKLEAKAARKFQNPDLARKLLADQADDFLDDKGNPDVEAINEALEELLEDEPYLAVQDGQKFQGTADGGTRNGSGKPAQLTRDDLKRMSPQEITKAKAEGRLNDVLGIKV